MKPTSLYSFATCLALALVLTMLSASQVMPPTNSVASVGVGDIMQPKDLPEVGKWMLDADSAPSQWLGEVYEGRHLREPINIIILDHVADSVDEAKSRLIEAATTAGYPSRTGHSSGYQGYIAGQLFAQLPEENDHAFSNRPFYLNNNHGRIFGPYLYQGSYLFIGAFSREKVAPLASVRHQYVSFNQARDDFAESLDRKTAYKTTGFVSLDNAIVTDPDITTGDHDGTAVLIMAEE